MIARTADVAYWGCQATNTGLKVHRELFFRYEHTVASVPISKVKFSGKNSIIFILHKKSTRTDDAYFRWDRGREEIAGSCRVD